jgi:hypothetical protein
VNGAPLLDHNRAGLLFYGGALASCGGIEKHTLSTFVVLLHWRLYVVSVRVTGTWTVLQSLAGLSQHCSIQIVLQRGD